MVFRTKKKEGMSEKEKLEERREEILAKGRKFKYPLQVAKHKMVLYTIVVVVVVAGMLTGMGYLALYRFQMSGDLLYKITLLLPAGVAKIDGEKVRFSDYLMIYRSSITPIEKQQGKIGNDRDGETMRKHYKRLALTEAENYSYALKLGREMGIKVGDEMVEAAIAAHRKAGGVERSEKSFSKVLEDNFNLSLDEYRRVVYLSLMKREVATKIDSEAAKTAEEIERRIKAGEELKQIAEELAEKVVFEETGGMVDKMNVDGGRAEAAMNLQQGKVSGRIVSSNGDGYYFVKLVDKTETTVNYLSIKVPLRELEARTEAIRKAGKVKEYIELAEEDVL